MKLYYYESKDGLNVVSSVGNDGLRTIESSRLLTGRIFLSKSDSIEENAKTLVEGHYSESYRHRVIETAEELNSNYILKEYTPEMMKERRLTIMLTRQNEYTTNVVMSIKNLIMLIDVTSIADLDYIDTYVNQLSQSIERLKLDKEKELKRRKAISHE